ncbi:MAG: lipase family alpha/beta hydrolase [Nocardioides sp.]
MATSVGSPVPSGPGVLDALSLLTSVADELVVRTVRDTHVAWADRVHGLLRRPTRGASLVPELMHRGIAGGVYAGLGVGLRAASKGLDAAAARGLGPRLEDSARGRHVNAAVNGLIGDRLARERPRLAVPMAIRVAGRDVPPERGALADAFPDARRRIVLFLHGLSESEAFFDLHAAEVGATYADTVSELGWTPVFLRANTGLPVRENGADLSALLRDLVTEWPAEVERIALVGHSMGGLVMRAACAVAIDAERPWTALVTDVVTLGTPHLGAPLAGGVGRGARALARWPETAAFGRILDQRSAGVHDLVDGLADDVPPLPHGRYRLVSATLTTSPRHPLGALVGDLLVRQPSAYGRSRRYAGLFPGADELHLPRAGHFALLNHPRVHDALREWLADPQGSRRSG